jgi:hypothetical protein
MSLGKHIPLIQPLRNDEHLMTSPTGSPGEDLNQKYPFMSTDPHLRIPLASFFLVEVLANLLPRSHSRPLHSVRSPPISFLEMMIRHNQRQAYVQASATTRTVMSDPTHIALRHEDKIQQQLMSCIGSFTIVVSVMKPLW